MQRPTDFDALWSKHQRNREVASHVVRHISVNRCTIVLGLTLGTGYEPRHNMVEASFGAKPAALNKLFRGTSVPDRFYLSAEQMADRLKSEWGPPDYIAPGSLAFDKISGINGVIFLKDAWPSPRHCFRRTRSHVDLWRGNAMGDWPSVNDGKDAEQRCKSKLKQAKMVWVWRIR